jgi:acetyltransferase-like isoleucine patch superfamily enzyme
MIHKILNKIIISLGKTDYKIDKNINSIDLMKIILLKSIQFIRSLPLYFQVKKAKGIIFLGKKVDIKFKSKLFLGRSIFIGDYVEINCLSKNGVIVGNNFSIHKNSTIECYGVLNEIGEGISIGNNVGISSGCFISVRGKIDIGDDVIFGPGVKIFSENHNFDDPGKTINNQGTSRKGIIIKSGSWIGANSIILDGVSIGANSIVSAGSVVTNNIPDGIIVAGIPAKKIRDIYK